MMGTRPLPTMLELCSPFNSDLDIADACLLWLWHVRGGEVAFDRRQFTEIMVWLAAWVCGLVDAGPTKHEWSTARLCAAELRAWQELRPLFGERMQ